ncbi:unnamed protein product [Pleuronectes platessa]|uniref:Uncharacterized protein n=1 Tax=Pleuronectes platessa TaxID=8262 RepID=A0A9N7TKP8_PLEPL|nr:unnamed protein product [Pleuronectes platessa]
MNPAEEPAAESVAPLGFMEPASAHHFLCPLRKFTVPASQGLQAIQRHGPAPEKEAGTMIPAGPYPGSGDTAGASLNSHLHREDGMCRERPVKRAINYAVAQNISRAAVWPGTEAAARQRHAAAPLKPRTWS